MTDHPEYLQKKATIMKTRVGCVKTSTYDLPGGQHSYGAPNKADDCNVSETISSWITANPSLEKVATKMTVYSNVLAVKHGCITARAMRQYGIDHPNIRLKEVLTNDSARGSANHEGPFGMKTTFAKESMDALLGAKYTNYSNEDADYPVVNSIKKTGFMPTPRPTVASQATQIARDAREAQAEPKHFTMRKFKDVKGTFSTQPTGPHPTKGWATRSSPERPEQQE